MKGTLLYAVRQSRTRWRNSHTTRIELRHDKHEREKVVMVGLGVV